MRLKSINRAVIATGLILSVATATATAQSYPDRPVKLIVPFAAGGPMDTMARLRRAERCSARAQASRSMVENRAGAGGGARLEGGGDGGCRTSYTLLWGSSGTHLDPARRSTRSSTTTPKALAPVALVSLLPHVLVVPTGGAGQDGAGVRRLREGQSGQAQLRRLAGHAAAPEWARLFKHLGRPRHRLHPVQGRRALDRRPDGRARRTCSSTRSPRSTR